jgi:hypothetical protein
MNSRFFSTFDLTAERNSDFVPDLRLVLKMGDEQLRELLDALPKLMLARHEWEKSSAANDFASSHGLDRSDSERALVVTRFLCNKLRDPDFAEDTPTLWGEDLSASDLLAADEIPRFVQLVSALKEIVVPAVGLELERRECASGYLPFFSAMGITVELRGMFKHKFKLGCSASEYQPELADVVPVVSVAIGVDEENRPPFTFQMDERAVDEMIGYLEVAKRQIQELKRSRALP